MSSEGAELITIVGRRPSSAERAAVAEWLD